ncbi:subtilase [Striga asiatica]|uniref:Subtilase n=1 Tax=Striga asiatica TaxID=4170 RepID=A0A5A7QG77_STRAF|nr:subtilase [Striga asiatica]
MALQTLFHTLILSLFPLLSVLVLARVDSQLKTYIVHVKRPKVDDDIPLTSYHKSLLPHTVPNHSLIYSYKHVISGFSARLTSQEVKAMKANKAIISAHVQTIYHPLTTRSPEFLGMNPRAGTWKHTKFGRGIIIDLVDTGIFPTHPSFRDHDMPCPPATWQGTCEPPNPIDYTGHGTHTASTAADGFVPDANVFGQAHGSHHRRQSRHPVIIPRSSKPLYKNIFELGAYDAAKKGILVSSSAGNDGPSECTVVNEAPWMLTIGSSTIDRRIQALAILGNGWVFDGESVFQPKNFSEDLLRLVYCTGPDGRQYCHNRSLAGIKVRGKVVLCDGSLRIFQVDQRK